MQFNYFQNLGFNFSQENRLIHENKRKVEKASSAPEKKDEKGAKIPSAPVKKDTRENAVSVPVPKGASITDRLRAEGGYYYARFPKKEEEPGKQSEKKEEKDESPEDTKAALADAKKKQKSADDLTKLAGKLGVKKDVLTGRKSKSLKRRMQKEIYGGDKELMKKYFEAMKEAIEKLPSNSLYKFIFDHTPEGKNWYEKSEYKDWNKEFAKLMEEYLPDELKAKPDEIKKHKYITGGLQNYLVKHFAPANVFQAGRSKRLTNPFIYVDGKMGGYTISVMAEYWNNKYGSQNKDKDPLKHAKLDEKYAAQRKNSEIYNKALTDLIKLLGSTATTQPAKPGSAPSPSSGAKVAEGGDKPATTPDPTPPQVLASMAEAEESLKDAPKDIKEKVKGLESAIFRNGNNSLRMINNARSDQLEDYVYLRDEKDKDPSWGWWIRDFDAIPGSAPDLAFKKYQKIYDKIDEKGEEPSTNKEVLAALENLGKAVNEYNDKVKVEMDRLKKEKLPRVLELIQTHDLPKDTDMTMLEIVFYDTDTGGGGSMESIEYKDKIFPEGLRNKEKQDEFIAKFFTEPFPTSTFKDNDTASNIEALKKLLKDPKDETFASIKSYIVSDDAKLIERLNEIIYLRNMYLFHDEIVSLREEFDVALNKKISDIDKTYA